MRPKRSIAVNRSGPPPPKLLGRTVQRPSGAPLRDATGEVQLARDRPASGARVIDEQGRRRLCFLALCP